jgi:DNA-binding NarL/FixJ family response regulator
MNGVRAMRIVVADSSRLLREALSHVLDSEPDFDVVGDADSGPSLLRLVAEREPDVVLIDIEMPGEDPGLLVRQLHEVSPTLAVVALSLHGDPRLLPGLVDLGVSAYLHKGISQSLLKSTIRDVAGSRRQTVTISIRAGVSIPLPEQAPPSTPSADAQPLSVRELEVLQLVAEAMTNRQVASRMDIAEGTVKRHLRNIFAKLDATSRIDAVNKAVDAELIQPPGTRRRP